MILFDVIDKALKDPNFAAKLQAQAVAAQRAGVDTDEWEDLMKNFARNPKELAILRTLHAPGEVVCTTTTRATITTMSTAACTMTTTTTTATYFTEEPKKLT
jgi:tRNA U34 5-carboxymethylaminomethyl modifying enzyme MnmG/GidA